MARGFDYGPARYSGTIFAGPDDGAVVKCTQPHMRRVERHADGGLHVVEFEFRPSRRIAATYVGVWIRTGEVADLSEPASVNA